MTEFVTGCTHFGHANIIKLANRPFADVDEMDRALIANWNAVVGAKDTVYHLGDFAFRGGPGEEYLKRLNGRIIRLQGNHDPNGWGRDYMRVKCNKTRAVLFHYPIEEWDGWFRGAVHLHCHTHSPNFVSGVRRGNVGVDATGFSPLKLEEAVARLAQ
ncbi:calcineurin-like phosphoesterase family protein [Sulfitobacter undariae]|uniref:Calcineurin-like phosphoesterase family protein n=1 Tax=Sulfitobacter undariae TaxID=1563671 RepID=A0A7W6H0P6_9RHOB|nr:metallophosphoesterase [Sulfitobacter undariae]MBB3994820.1 calcineurin-like phosphoesterase family protein [Sulfitobacter undariae]